MTKLILSIFTALTMAVGVFAQIPTTDLIGQYDFSNGGLTDNINGADFTKTGTASTSITDRFGNANEAISLNGDDLLRPDIDFNLSSSNPFLARTISFWVKTATNDGNVRLIYNDNNRTYVGAINYNGLIVYLQNGQVKASNRVGSNGNLVTHSTPVSDDNWHHVVIQGYSTEISGTKRFYTYVFIDGVKEGGNGYQTGSNTVSATENEHIGSIGFSRLENLSLGNSQKYIDGLDEVLFYTKVLTDLEVDSITTNGFCTVNIPDANFKAYLVGTSAINTNGDTEIQCSEASAFTGSLNCQSSNISDLIGIEFFTNITQLNCENNSLTSLDVSQNTDLWQLRFGDNPISSIDLSQNTGLTVLNCNNTPLNSLDVSQNLALTDILCINTGLSTLDVSQNTDLLALRCNDNSLTNIDVSQNTDLYYLFCENNSLTSLDVSQNTNLNRLSVDGNLLTDIDLSQNVSLERFTCMNNLLDGLLDISANTDIYLFNCSDNLLTELNVANGNNTNFTLFNASFNPNLFCVQVDDEVYSTANWTNISAQASFSNNCPVFVSSIVVQGQGGASTITTQGGTLQMEATVLPANADDATYTWSVTNGTGSASIDVNGILTAITDGTVTVIANANDASGVAGTATITISNQSVGLSKIDTKDILVYPNPVTNELFIDVAEGQINQIQIIDYTGRVVTSITGKQVQSIDVSNLNQGVYILKIQTNKGVSTIQFIKK